MSKLSALGESSGWNGCGINIILKPDVKSRAALEAIWLENASKEHISVPAFSKLSMQLIALGAPPELMEKVFRAASQEITHAMLSYSVASSLSGKAFSPDAMPEILKHSCEYDSLEKLILECFIDGCLMEALSAAHARESSLLAQEPAIKNVFDVIARDEQFHADLSWEIVHFLQTKVSTSMKLILSSELKTIKTLPTPDFFSAEIVELIGKADNECMQHFGVLPRHTIERLWHETVHSVELQLNGGWVEETRGDLLKPIPPPAPQIERESCEVDRRSKKVAISIDTDRSRSWVQRDN